MICPHCKAINPDHYKTCYVCKKNMDTAKEFFDDLMNMVKNAEQERQARK